MKAELHKLEEKYWQGKTTLEEEAVLKRAVAESREGLSGALRAVMNDAAAAGMPELDNDFDDAFWQKAESRDASAGGAILPLALWLRYAAAAVILIAVTTGAFHFFQNEDPAIESVASVEQVDSFEDPEEALKEAIEALNFASEKLNSAKKPAEEIKRFHQSKMTITGNPMPSGK